MEESLYMRFLYIEKGAPVTELMKCLLDYSCATIFRPVKRPVNRPFNKRNLYNGRPKKLSLRDEQNIVGQISRMRSKIRTLHTQKIGPRRWHCWGCFYVNYLKRYWKSIMKPTVFTKRMKCSRTALKYRMDFWTKSINFYLDGTGFTHKHNPHDEARSIKTMAWRKKSEGLNPLWITKGKLAVTGGRMAHFKVALSGRSVALCHQYQGCLDGKRFASMVHKIFPDIYKKTEHCEGRLLLQDGCLVEISAAGLKAMKKVKADVFSIPLRSPDFNPIEYFFNLILKKLNDDALENMITFESIEEVSIKEVDKIIKSMHNRIKKILQRKGQRLRY